MLNLKKLHLTVSKSLLTQEIWAGAWVFSVPGADIIKQPKQHKKQQTSIPPDA